MFKKITLTFLLSFCVYSNGADIFKSVGIKQFGGDDGVHGGLTLSGAAVGGAGAYIVLKTIERDVIGIKESRLVTLSDFVICSFLPGLIAAYLMDDGKINGSIFNDCYRLYMPINKVCKIYGQF